MKQTFPVKAFLIRFLLIPAANSFAKATVMNDLRCEFLTEPLGIDDTQQALSWTIEDIRKGVSPDRQKAGFKHFYLKPLHIPTF